MIKLFKQLKQKITPLLIGAALFALAAMVGVPASASAASSDGYWGQLISKNTPPPYRKCLTAQGDPGNSVYQDYCSNDSWKLWHMQPIGNGYYKIQSGWDGHCLDVYAYSHNNYAKVTTWPCISGASNQEWTLGLSSTGFALKPRHAQYDNSGRGKCLDVFAYSHNNGAPVVQWDCLGGVNQFWSFRLW